MAAPLVITVGFEPIVLYRPWFVVSTVLTDSSANQVYDELSSMIRQAGTLDLEDPETAYRFRKFGVKEELRFNIGDQYIDD